MERHHGVRACPRRSGGKTGPASGQPIDAVETTALPTVEPVRGRRPATVVFADVVLSSDAWTDYEVPGSPYFVLVASDQIVVWSA